MNEQVEEKANELLLGLIDKAQQGMDFAEAQIPDVIEQLLVWKFFESAIFAFLGLIMLAGAIYGFKFWRMTPRIDPEKGDHNNHRPTVFRDRDGDFKEVIVPFCFLQCTSAVIGCIFFFSGAMSAVQIAIAPKIYLLEYAASLAK